MKNNIEGGKNKPGEHQLALRSISLPDESLVIQDLMKERSYEGWEAISEAQDNGLLRPVTRHAELSPTFTCPEDCGGCPDRISLHMNEPNEVRINVDSWYRTVDGLQKLGVEYFMLIGGTIDRDPTTPKLMRYIRKQGGDVGWFTDGIMLQKRKNGDPTTLFEQLLEGGNLREVTTHVSADYAVSEGMAECGPLLPDTYRWRNASGGSRWFKSAYGERLARRLIDEGVRRVILNTAISAQNIDEVLKVYHYVSELQDYANNIGSETVVLWTCSPWVWRPHLARGDDPRNYDLETLLQPAHQEKLQEISDHIYNDTLMRLISGLPRVAANSSGFIRGLSQFSIDQDIPYVHGSSEFAVQPDGTVRIDPIFTSSLVLPFAKNPYGYRDRDIDHNPFDRFNNGLCFPNLVQTTRDEKIPWR